MPESQDNATLYDPNYSILEATGFGFELAPLVTEDKIAACENLLVQARQKFFTDVAADMSALLQLARTYATESSVLLHVYNIKSHATLFGFSLIIDICEHLVSVMTSTKIMPDKRHALLGKLVAALTLCFEHQIRDDGGEIGEQLRLKLQALR